MSQAEIGSLRVKLGIDTAEFANGLKSAQSSLSGLSSALKGFAAGMAASLSFGALTVALKNTADRMDALGKAAQKVGIPVDDLSKLDYAARLSDVSLDSLTTTLAKFSRSISEISAGGENDAGAALNAIGISATDAEGRLRPTSVIIEDVAAQFATMRDGANKTALAIALFGKSGAEMIPLLNGGREALASAGAELEQFGGVVTPEAARQAERLNDNLTRFQEASSGLTQQITEGLIGPLADLTEMLLDFAKNSDLAKNAAGFFKTGLQEVASTAATTYKEFHALVQIAIVLMENLSNPTNIEGSLQRWQNAFAAIKAQAAETAETLARINGGSGLTSGFSASQGDLAQMLGSIDPKRDAPSLPGSSGAAKLVPPGTIEDIYGAGEAVSALEEAFKGVTPEAGLFSDALLSIGDTITSSLGGALSQLISGTMSVQEAFTSMAQGIVKTLTDLAAELAVMAILKVILGGLGGGFGAGLNIGGMMFGGLYANGGTLGAGQWGIAGEAGPEIIHGPARITPMDKAGAAVPVNISIVNNSSAQVNARQGGDGQIDIMIEERVAAALVKGGNKIDAAMQRGYGLRRTGR